MQPKIRTYLYDVCRLCQALLGFIPNRSLGDRKVDIQLRSGVGILVIGICLAVGGCAKELTPYGRARQADTIAAYEEFIRNNPRDPRVRYARQRVESLRLPGRGQKTRGKGHGA